MLVLYQLLHVLHLLYGTFIHFFGTNLLTRCRSASSCFLLFLYSRKSSLEIFSELDETSRGMLFYQNTPDGAKKQQRKATWAPHAPRARVPPRRALGWCGPHGSLQPPPFRLLIPPEKITISACSFFCTSPLLE